MTAQDDLVPTTGSSEEAAFERLYLATRADLLAHLHRRTGGWAGGASEAADLLAQVYLVAWRRRDALPPQGQQRPWLYGIARLVLAEHHRTRPGHAALDDLTEQQVVTGRGAPADDPHAGGPSEQVAALRRALADLPDADRELLLLTVWDGMSSAEAARSLGISAGAARVRLHRARHRLRSNDVLAVLLRA